MLWFDSGLIKTLDNNITRQQNDESLLPFFTHFSFLPEVAAVPGSVCDETEDNDAKQLTKEQTKNPNIVA